MRYNWQRRDFPRTAGTPADVTKGGSTLPHPRPVLESLVGSMDTSHIAEHAGTAGALFASVFVVATTTMRTMIPLRVFSILTNVVLIVSSIPGRNYPTGLLHMVLLVLNSYRLHQMLQLLRDVKRSVNSDLSMDWLKPFMTERKCQAGEMLFYKDEKAEDMLYIVSGRFKLVESGIELPVGAIVGELGMLSPSNLRTQSLECIESGVILSVSYTKVEELYVENPEFGFYFLRLASARLFQNINTLEQRLAQLAQPSVTAIPKSA
jgi:cyclic nucleotide-binding protein